MRIRLVVVSTPTMKEIVEEHKLNGYGVDTNALFWRLRCLSGVGASGIVKVEV